MSISGISGISNGSATSQVQGGFRSAMKEAMGAVASKLGMSVTDLQTELKGGKSLSDVAQAKGISPADLLATIKQAITSSGSSASGNSLDALANRIANHKGGQHHGGSAQGVQGTSGSEASESTTRTSNTSGADKDGDNDGR